MEELQLISNLKEGDQNSFRIVVDKYQKMTLNCCYRFVLNKETAEDLTQDVFVEVFRSIGSFKNKSKLSTWIYRIAISKSLDHLKSMKRKKRFALTKSLSEDEENPINFEQIIYSNRPGPQKNLEDEDRIKTLDDALATLPDNQKVAFSLSKFDDMTYREISDVLDVSVSSVESLIHRAKVNLRKKLYKYYDELLK